MNSIWREPQELFQELSSLSFCTIFTFYGPYYTRFFLFWQVSTSTFWFLVYCSSSILFFILSLPQIPMDMDMKLRLVINMIFEKNRLKTFDKWMYNNKNVSCTGEKVEFFIANIFCSLYTSSLECENCNFLGDQILTLIFFFRWQKLDFSWIVLRIRVQLCVSVAWKHYTDGRKMMILCTKSYSFQNFSMVVSCIYFICCQSFCSAEHQKHSPKCLFVKLEKEEVDLTVSEMLLIAEEVDSNLLVSIVQTLIHILTSSDCTN